MLVIVVTPKTIGKKYGWIPIEAVLSNKNAQGKFGSSDLRDLKYKYKEKIIKKCEANATCLNALSIITGEKQNSKVPRIIMGIFSVNSFMSIAEDIPCSIKQSITYIPKYWNVSGSTGDKTLNNIATIGIESVNEITPPAG